MLNGYPAGQGHRGRLNRIIVLRVVPAALQAELDQPLLPGQARHIVDFFWRRVAGETERFAVRHVFAKASERANILVGNSLGRFYFNESPLKALPFNDKVDLNAVLGSEIGKAVIFLAVGLEPICRCAISRSFGTFSMSSMMIHPVSGLACLSTIVGRMIRSAYPANYSNLIRPSWRWLARAGMATRVVVEFIYEVLMGNPSLER